MSFKIATLEGIISHSDEQATLFRGLVQAFIDHGASYKELEKLLTDAKNEKRFFGLLAKKVMGRIWELAEEEPFVLDPIDFDAPPLTFLEGCSKELYIHDVYRQSLLDDRWLENKPKETCRYRLIHQASKVSRWKAFRNPELPDGVEYAGWRELAWYVSKLEPGDLKHCMIFGLATPGLDSRGEVRDDFFYLHEKRRGIELDALTVNGTMYLNETCFHLVRVYPS